MRRKDKQDNFEKRFEAAGEWITLSSEHADIAVTLSKKSRTEKHALYHTQQSMETATKGLAIAGGVSHEHVRKRSHDYPYLFYLLLDKIIRESDGIQYANEMLSPYYKGDGKYDVEKQLGKMLSLTSSPKSKDLSKAQRDSAEQFFDGLVQFPPEGVEEFLNQLDKLNVTMRQTLNKEGPIAQFIKEPFTFRPSRADGSFVQSIYQQLLEQARNRPGSRKLTATETTLLLRMATQMEVNLKADYSEEQIWEWLDIQGGRLSIDAGKEDLGLNSFFDLQSVLVGILILGSLVWPHESYSRYPAPPDSPDSIDQAAKRTRKGRSLGTKHYTQELGVIRHIRPLTTQTKRTVAFLQKCYERNYLLTSIPNDS